MMKSFHISLKAKIVNVLAILSILASGYCQADAAPSLPPGTTGGANILNKLNDPILEGHGKEYVNETTFSYPINPAHIDGDNSTSGPNWQHILAFVNGATTVSVNEPGTYIITVSINRQNIISDNGTYGMDQWAKTKTNILKNSAVLSQHNANSPGGQDVNAQWYTAPDTLSAEVNLTPDDKISIRYDIVDSGHNEVEFMVWGTVNFTRIG
jgi:hypothetical protein